MRREKQEKIAGIRFIPPKNELITAFNVQEEKKEPLS